MADKNYSGYHDYSGDEPDYSSLSDEELEQARQNHPGVAAIERDLLGDNYDKYYGNKKSLADAEKNEGQKGNDSKSTRDIGKQERGVKGPDWSTNLAVKRDTALNAARNKNNSFFSRHKSAFIGGGSALILAGGITIFALPAIAIGQFAQVANLIKNTVEITHELMTGSRSMRNMLVSARAAARSMVSDTFRTHFQTTRAGMFGQMVGENYLNKLKDAGVTIGEGKWDGRWESITIDIEKTSGSSTFKNMSDANKLDYIKNNYPDIDTSKIDKLALSEGKIKLNGRMSYSDTLKTLRALDAATGTSNFTLAREIKIRYLARMLGIYSWLHPIENLKGKLYEAVKASYNKKQNQKTADGSAATPTEQERPKQPTDPDTGKEVFSQEVKNAQDAWDAAHAQLEAGKAKVNASGFKVPKFPSGLVKAAAGFGIASIITAVICTAVSYTDHIVANKKAIVDTMSAEAQQYKSQWGQIQASMAGLDGDAIDYTTLRVMRESNIYNDKVLENYDVDDEGQIVEGTGNYTERSVVDSLFWKNVVDENNITLDQMPYDDQQPIQTTPQELYASRDGGIMAKFSKIIGGNEIAKKLCGTEFGQLLVTAMGLVAGGWVEAIINVAITALTAIPAVADKIGQGMQYLFQLGTGKPLSRDAYDDRPNKVLDVAVPGEQAMVNANFAGGSAGTVTAAEHYENQLIAQEWLDAEWKSRPLAERLFDASDYRSTVAQVVNNAHINAMPSDINGYFANWAKLIGAVPNFISSGLFGSKKSEALAAGMYFFNSAPTPIIEYTNGFASKLTGDPLWDLDTNFWGCSIGDMNDQAQCTTTKVTGVKQLLDDDMVDSKYNQVAMDPVGHKFRDYAEQCLGKTIAYEDGTYTVKDLPDDQNPNGPLLVGFHNVDGSWNKNSCEAKVTKGAQGYKGETYSDSDIERYQRIGVYAGMDYPDLAGYAWYGSSDSNPETQKIANEIFGDGSGSGSNGSSDNTNSPCTSCSTIVQYAESALGKTAKDFSFADGISWCGYFAAWVLKQYDPSIALPSGYPGAANWKNASGRLTYHSGSDGLQAGDIIIFGSSHVGISIGGGQHIGGNEGGERIGNPYDTAHFARTSSVKKNSDSWFDPISGYVRVGN